MQRSFCSALLGAAFVAAPLNASAHSDSLSPHPQKTASPAADKDGANGDYGGYLTYPEIKAKIAEWKRKYPRLVHESVLGKTYEGRPIPLLRLSPDAVTSPSKPEVLIMSGIHPREQQPQVCLMRLLDEVLSGYGKDARMTALLNDRTIWVVPILNVDGKVYDMSPDHGGNGTTRGADWRKNRRPNGDGTVGVDLNRNFAVRWGGNRGIDPLWRTSTLDTGGNIYEGPSPISEPENQALASFMTSRPNLRAFLDIHSPLRFIGGPTFLIRPDWERYNNLFTGMQKLQKDRPYKINESHADAEPGLDTRGGNTGLTYTWSFYTRGIYGSNFEISDPDQKTGIGGRYPAYESILKEYDLNVREPLLYWFENASKLPAATPGKLVCTGAPIMSRPATPGAALTFTPPTPTGGPCAYAVLVSPSPDVLVPSEFRLVPFKSGFSITIEKSAQPGTKVPLDLYLWDSDRHVSKATFLLEIVQPSAL